MQRSWRTDKDKLTFIVCLPLPRKEVSEEDVVSIGPGEYDSDETMIGDINLFLLENEGETDNPITNDTATNGRETSLIGEIELMIARKELQRRGYGRAALLTFIEYVLLNWHRIAGEYAAYQNSCLEESPQPKCVPELAYLRAKIHETNERSIRLFKSVGFATAGDGHNYFGELELRWRHDVGYLERLRWFEKSRMLDHSGE